MNSQTLASLLNSSLLIRVGGQIPLMKNLSINSKMNDPNFSLPLHKYTVVIYRVGWCIGTEEIIKLLEDYWIVSPKRS